MNGGAPNGDTATLHYFVDEAGDPTLFNRRGRVTIGNEGCSKYFILGKLDVTNPGMLNIKLDGLRSNLLADPYFKDVPSMQREQRKTALAFHAKNDLAEVRREVFRLLTGFGESLRFYAVVRDKQELVSYVRQRNEREPGYRYSENELYDTLVQELFRHFRYSADEMNITFAKRGRRDRTAAFRRALEKAEDEFERGFGFRRRHRVEIKCTTPAQSGGLQAVDYYLWALQRFYERGEDRFVELIWPQVGEVYDLDLVADRRPGVVFRKGKPLNADTRPFGSTT